LSKTAKVGERPSTVQPGGSGTQNVTRINNWGPRRTFLSVILRVVIDSIGNVFIERLRLLLKGYWIIHPNILYS